MMDGHVSQRCQQATCDTIGHLGASPGQVARTVRVQRAKRLIDCLTGVLCNKTRTESRETDNQ
jgi:hypothetical protein